MNSQSSLEDRRVAIALWSVAIVIAVIITLIVVKVSSSQSGSASDTSGASAPAALVSKLASVNEAVTQAVGVGSIQGLPVRIDAPSLAGSGKPEVVYIGAEYCPYCAAERWPMVVALSRFGSFSGLGLTHSASADVYPNTQTLSFHGATYSSTYLSFSGVETMSNKQQGSSYAPLDTPTSDQEALLNKYDAAPYVSSGAAGGIPFIDFGGKYLINGATYDPSILQGKTADQISAALSDPTDPITKGVVGSANVITAAICTLTGNQPAAVCTSSIQTLETQLNGQAVSGGTSK